MIICTQMEEVKSWISQRLLHEFLGFVPTIILRMHANSLNPVTAVAAAAGEAAAAAAVVVVDVRVGGGTGGPFPAGKPVAEWIWPLNIVQIKNKWIYASTPQICPHGVHTDNSIILVENVPRTL